MPRLKLDPTSQSGVSIVETSANPRRQQANGYVVNKATGLITAGSNVTFTGNGTPESPYVVSTTSNGEYNVKAYGALGNDTTDDTAAIQSAINACPEGGVVYFPAGKYRTTSPLYVPRGVTLQGTEAPRWSYTYAPQTYIKIRSTFSGLGAIHLRDKELGGYATEQGNIRIKNICIDGSAYTGSAVAGIRATGLVKDVRLQNVSCRYMKGNGIYTEGYTRADTLTYFPRGWELSHVVADTCGNIGFSFNNLDDSILFDCLAVGNLVYGFFLAGLGEDHLTNCRAVFNGSIGFYITGTTYGSTVFSGITTDRNELDGIRVDATGKLPLIFSGIGLRRDGRNGDSGGAGYASMRITAAAVPIVISGMITMTGQNDDATGTMSPQYGLRVGSSTSVQVNNAYIHGFTAGIQDDGSNTDFYLGSSITTATGSANAPTISTDHAWTAKGKVTVPSFQLTGGTPAAGKTIISDASGNGVWQRLAEWTPDDHGLITWSANPALVNAVAIVPTAGQVNVIKLHVPVATTITNIVMAVSTAGATLTANQNFAALYTSAGALLSSTADQSASWNSTGIKTMALAAAQAVAAGDYYVAFYSNGTTQPTFRTGGSAGSIANVGLSLANSRFATADTGRTTSMPSTLAALAVTAVSWWCALS